MNNLNHYYYVAPNLSIVENLSPDDYGFQKRFIQALFDEFTKYLTIYQYHMDLSEPRTAAIFVIKLKATLGYLGMTDSFKLIDQHEENLRYGNKESEPIFMKILIDVKKFLLRQTA